MPDDVKDRVPGGDDDDDGRTGTGLRSRMSIPRTSRPASPRLDGVTPQAALEPPARPNPFMPSPGSPMGSNDSNCVPSEGKPNPDRARPRDLRGPQLLVELRLADARSEMGYCVYAINYGSNGTRPIEDSAEELRDFVDGVLGAHGTVQAREAGVKGADKVSIVAHSQGGLMSRVYLKEEEGLGKVEDLVSLAASNHGTDNQLARPAEEQCELRVLRAAVPVRALAGAATSSPRRSTRATRPRVTSPTPRSTLASTTSSSRTSRPSSPSSGSRNGPLTAELNGERHHELLPSGPVPGRHDRPRRNPVRPVHLPGHRRCTRKRRPRRRARPTGLGLCADRRARRIGGDADRDEDGRDRDGNGKGNGNGSGAVPTATTRRPSSRCSPPTAFALRAVHARAILASELRPAGWRTSGRLRPLHGGHRRRVPDEQDVAGRAGVPHAAPEHRAGREAQKRLPRVRPTPPARARVARRVAGF
ncbi:MAG: hypothetical protein WKF31_03555 [Thermoleophilaceae bacterium]